MSAYADIADYAVIGDSRSAALISKRGSIDWLCLPRFDSPSIFNRLLDGRHGGHFTIAPTEPFTCRRWYRDTTPILMTEFRTSGGIVRLTDLVPVSTEAQKRTGLLPLWSLLRRLECIEGMMEMNIEVKPRPDHGRARPFEARGAAGYFLDCGQSLLHVTGTSPLSVDEDLLTGTAVIRAGEKCCFWLAYSEDAPSVYPAIGTEEEIIDNTASFWSAWSTRCRYHGPHRELVLRSALTLMLLTYAPSGAIVAAPTTSLPEVVGGERNWDYRYCWLRDASYTARIFLKLGYDREAEAFIDWMTHATALTYPALQVVYDVYGESSLPGRELQSVEGYRGSRPVRIGNQAHKQFQLDIYGEVLDAVDLYVETGHALDRRMQRRVVEMADLLTREWSRPDHSIWEIPGDRRHYVHSKVMCWVALDRAARIAERLHLSADLPRWRGVRDEIKRLVLHEGYSEEARSFVKVLGGQDVDATALLFGLCGFVQPKDRRMLNSLETVQSRLRKGDLVYRYLNDDGLPGQEGAFLPCGFWLVEALASADRREEAESLFERLQEYANDVGLYSEEQDPDGTLLGNFPQALTHLAHIEAALRLSEPRTS